MGGGGWGSLMPPITAPSTGSEATALALSTSAWPAFWELLLQPVALPSAADNDPPRPPG